jgi:hypothetical protein
MKELLWFIAAIGVGLLAFGIWGIVFLFAGLLFVSG